MNRINLTLSVPVSVKRDGKWYVCSCNVLDVHSQGKSEEEARRNLETAMVLFVESCLEMGTLEDVLRESGFHPTHDYQSEEYEPSMIHIPIHLLAQSGSRNVPQNCSR